MAATVKYALKQDEVTWRQSGYVSTLRKNIAKSQGSPGHHHCPMRHLLHWSRGPGWFCNRWTSCKTTGEQDTHRWSCSLCGYDICGSCLPPPDPLRTPIPKLPRLCSELDPRLPSPSLSGWGSSRLSPLPSYHLLTKCSSAYVGSSKGKIRKASSMKCGVADSGVAALVGLQNTMRKTMLEVEKREREAVVQCGQVQGRLVQFAVEAAGVWWGEDARCAFVKGSSVWFCDGGVSRLTVDDSLRVNVSDRVGYALLRLEPQAMQWANGDTWLRAPTLPSSVLSVVFASCPPPTLLAQISDLCSIDTGSTHCLTPPDPSPYWSPRPTIAGTDKSPYPPSLWATSARHVAPTTVRAAEERASEFLVAFRTSTSSLLDELLDALRGPVAANPVRVVFDMCEQFWFHYNHLYNEFKDSERNPQPGAVLGLLTSSLCTLNGVELDVLAGHYPPAGSLPFERNVNLLNALSQAPLDNVHLAAQYSSLVVPNMSVLHRWGSVTAEAMIDFVSLQKGDHLLWEGPVMASLSDTHSKHATVAWRIEGVPWVCPVGRFRCHSEDEAVAIPPMCLFEVTAAQHSAVTLRFVRDLLRPSSALFTLDATTSEARLRSLFATLQRPKPVRDYYFLSRTPHGKMQNALRYLRSSPDVLLCRVCPYKGARHLLLSHLVKRIDNMLSGATMCEPLLVALLQLYHTMAKNQVSHPIVTKLAASCFEAGLQHGEEALAASSVALLFAGGTVAQPTGNVQWDLSLDEMSKGLLLAPMPTAVQIRHSRHKATLSESTVEHFQLLLSALLRPCSDSPCSDKEIVLWPQVECLLKLLIRLGGWRAISHAAVPPSTPRPDPVDWSEAYRVAHVADVEGGAALVCLSAAAAYRPPSGEVTTKILASVLALTAVAAVHLFPPSCFAVLLLKALIFITAKGDTAGAQLLIGAFPQLEHGPVPVLCGVALNAEDPKLAHLARKAALEIVGCVGQVEGWGWTSLHYCCRRGYVDVVETLIDEGGLEEPDVWGAMPLHAALTGLASATCEVGTTMYDGRLVMGVEKHMGCSTLRKLATPAALRQREGVRGETALHKACRLGQRDIVTLLLDRGADPEAVDNAGAVPLHYACGETKGLLGVPRLCTQTAPGANSTAGPPLHTAVRAHNLPTVLTLLSHGADPQDNTVDVAKEYLKHPNGLDILRAVSYYPHSLPHTHR